MHRTSDDGNDLHEYAPPSRAVEIRSVIAMTLVEIEQEFTDMTPAQRADLIIGRLVEHGFDVTELDMNA